MYGAVARSADVGSIAGNTAWVVGDRFVRVGMSAMMNILVARYLGPEKFGIISFVASFAALFTVLTSLGLDNVIIRELVRSPETAPEILGTGFVLRATGAVVASIALPLTIYASGEREGVTLKLGVIFGAGGFFSICEVISLFFQARVEAKYTAWAASGSFIAAAVVKVFLMWAGEPCCLRMDRLWGSGGICNAPFASVLAHRTFHEGMAIRLESCMAPFVRGVAIDGFEHRGHGLHEN